MGTLDELTPQLKALRLSGMLESLDLRVAQAVEEESDYATFLLRLVRDEVERRQAKQQVRRERSAGFESNKTLLEFDFAFNKTIPKAKVMELANCSFVSRSDNVLLLGQTGVGKSHLAQAIGRRACRAGHKVLFVPTHTMFAMLRQAKGAGTYERRMQRLLNVDLLILDDVGLHGLGPADAVALYEVIRGRYERKSLMLTSNRDIDELMPLFADPLLGGAAIDRLLHHAHILRLKGRSYRTQAKRKPATA